MGRNPIEAVVFALACCGLALAAGAEPPRPEPGLTAETIYQRVLDNRFSSSIQEVAMLSSDQAGREQPVHVRMLWHRYDEGTAEYAKGVTSRTLIRYLTPPEVRGGGYLIINKLDLPNDQFMYLNSTRRVYWRRPLRRLDFGIAAGVGFDQRSVDARNGHVAVGSVRPGSPAVVAAEPCSRSLTGVEQQVAAGQLNDFAFVATGRCHIANLPGGSMIVGVVDKPIGK